MEAIAESFLLVGEQIGGQGLVDLNHLIFSIHPFIIDGMILKGGRIAYVL